MKLAHRFAYYLGGFTIGIIILFFFLGGKRASCEYGPNSRTLKNIRLKKRAFTEETLQTLSQNELDTAAISSLLQHGDVLFSESNTKLDSCKLYAIEGKIGERSLKINVQNCDKTATVLNAVIEH